MDVRGAHKELYDQIKRDIFPELTEEQSIKAAKALVELHKEREQKEQAERWEESRKRSERYKEWCTKAKEALAKNNLADLYSFGGTLESNYGKDLTLANECKRAWEKAAKPIQKVIVCSIIGVLSLWLWGFTILENVSWPLSLLTLYAPLVVVLIIANVISRRKIFCGVFGEWNKVWQGRFGFIFIYVVYTIIATIITVNQGILGIVSGVFANFAASFVAWCIMVHTDLID